MCVERTHDYLLSEIRPHAGPLVEIGIELSFFMFSGLVCETQQESNAHQKQYAGNFLKLDLSDSYAFIRQL